MISARNKEESDITVISDDSYFLILLLQYYHTGNMKNRKTMELPIKKRTVIDIEKTVKKHVSFVCELPAHALTGYDTVACCYGVGKDTALKVPRDSYLLSLLGVIDSPIEAVIEQQLHSYLPVIVNILCVNPCLKHSGEYWRQKRVEPRCTSKTSFLSFYK